MSGLSLHKKLEKNAGLLIFGIYLCPQWVA